MASCLGIYLDNNIVKYAKLSLDNGKTVNVQKYGLKFTGDNHDQVISQIIQETESQNIPVVLNPIDDLYYTSHVYEQVKNNSYVSDIMKLEFEAWCEKNAKSPDKYSYVYFLSDYKNSENRRMALLNITLKDSINSEIRMVNSLSQIMPAKPIVKRIVSDDEENYILINIDTKLSITVVINKKIVEFKVYDFGMKQVLDDFTRNLGSYEKAFQACKQINVYTEGESTNDPNLEQIIEPILQQILKECQVEVNKYAGSISKVFLTGVGTSFTNVDLLFSQFLDIKASIIKPFFIKDVTDVRYVSEIIEVTEAIVLAYEYLNPQFNEIRYLTSAKKINSKVNKIFAAPTKIIKPKKSKEPKEVKEPQIEDETVNKIGYAAIATAVILIAYVVFGVVYSFSINRMVRNMEVKKQNIVSETANVNSDIDYVNKNMKEYKDINDEVENIKNKIEKNEIGKFSTYNVASLLQNIIRIIPQNVRLINITSNDNKNITITASSDEYEYLGYFFAQLKLEGVINNAKINKVNNGETTTIEIGGDMP